MNRDSSFVVQVGNATFCGTTLAARMAAVVRVGPHRAGHGVMQNRIGDVKRPYDGELLFSAELTSTEL